MKQSVLQVYDNPIEFFKDLAMKVHKRESVATGVRDDGFVLNHSLGKVVFAGVKEDDDTYIVGKMWAKKETVGRHEPRMKVRENKYVECQMYRMRLPEPEDSDGMVELIADTIDNDEYEEKIDTGYINGYRLTRLDDVLEEIFKWY